MVTKCVREQRVGSRTTRDEGEFAPPRPIFLYGKFVRSEERVPLAAECGQNGNK